VVAGGTKRAHERQPRVLDGCGICKCAKTFILQAATTRAAGGSRLRPRRAPSPWGPRRTWCWVNISGSSWCVHGAAAARADARATQARQHAARPPAPFCAAAPPAARRRWLIRLRRAPSRLSSAQFWRPVSWVLRRSRGRAGAVFTADARSLHADRLICCLSLRIRCVQSPARSLAARLAHAAAGGRRADCSFDTPRAPPPR
jgi:hypothetical protein